MVIVSAKKMASLVQSKYKVFLDGKEHSAIKGGEQIQIDLPTGFHQVFFSGYMGRTSKKLTFEVKAEEDMIRSQVSPETYGIPMEDVLAPPTPEVNEEVV